MAILGQPRSFHSRWRFRIGIDSFGWAGFAKCSELSAELGKSEHYEGGASIPYKSPGRLSFSDVTLERGATQDKDLFRWFSDVVSVASGLGLPDPRYKRNLAIVQMDRDGSTLRRWTLYRAFPIKFVAGEWDNGSDEAVIESITLTYDYFQLS